MNISPEWIKEKADKEAGQCILVGGLMRNTMIYYCVYERLPKIKHEKVYVAFDNEPPDKFITNELKLLESKDGFEINGHIEAKDLDHAYMVFKAQLVIQHKIIL